MFLSRGFWFSLNGHWGTFAFQSVMMQVNKSCETEKNTKFLFRVYSVSVVFLGRHWQSFGFNRTISVFVFLYLWLVTLLVFLSDVWKESFLLWDEMNVWSVIFVPAAECKTVAEVRLQEGEDNYVGVKEEIKIKEITKVSRLDGGKMPTFMFHYENSLYSFLDFSQVW